MAKKKAPNSGQTLMHRTNQIMRPFMARHNLTNAQMAEIMGVGYQAFMARISQDSKTFRPMHLNEVENLLRWCEDGGHEWPDIRFIICGQTGGDPMADMEAFFKERFPKVNVMDQFNRWKEGRLSKNT